MIYISSSWKNRERVRAMAITLREKGFDVYDFTDPKCRSGNRGEIPPEKYPEQFDPSKHTYKDYLNNDDWRYAVTENRKAIEMSEIVVLLLPCGVDATADWALGVGLGAMTYIVGHPNAGDRSPVHLWAHEMFDTDADFLNKVEFLGVRTIDTAVKYLGRTVYMNKIDLKGKIISWGFVLGKGRKCWTVECNGEAYDCFAENLTLLEELPDEENQGRKAR